MADYKEMYLSITRATEKAITILIEAQQKAEESYLSEPDTNIKVLSDFTQDKRKE